MNISEWVLLILLSPFLVIGAGILLEIAAAAFAILVIGLVAIFEACRK